MEWHSRARRTLTLVAVAASLALAGASPAAAATATLTIPYTGCQGGTGQWFDYTMRVQGTTASNLGRIRVEVRLWGEDEWYDDFLGGPYVQYYDWSGFYSVSFCVNRSTLDEDIGRDELYAGVRVYDAAANRQKESVESNRIRDDF